jgi:hypothetical protein
MIRILSIFILSIAVYSCSKSKLSASEYIAYMNDLENGYVCRRTFNGINYKTVMQTPEMIILRSGRQVSDPINFNKNVDEQKGNLNFVFTISDDDGSNRVKEMVFDQSKYGGILRYSNSMINEDFKLLQGNDTVYCALVHLEPANSINPMLRLTVAFSGIDQNSTEDLTLFFNDNIFMNGPLKFHFDKKIFLNKPEIIL